MDHHRASSETMKKIFLGLFAAGSILIGLNGCAGHPQVAIQNQVDAADANKSAENNPGIRTTPSSMPERPESQTSSESPTPAPKEEPAKEPLPTESMKNPNDKVAVITTKFGKIVIELNQEAAPKTSANFEKLTTEGFYNGTTFHRVIPGFMIQGGDPNSKSSDRSRHGMGGPGYTIPAEIGLKHVRGAVATARTGDEVNPQRASSGSQFFICVVDCPFLDGQYTVFGQVIKGMDVADKIVAQPRDARDNPTDRVEMQVAMVSREEALK